MSEPLSGYRWALGHISAAALDDTFDVTRFPVQPDQSIGRHWLRPDSASDVVSNIAELQESMTGMMFGTGGGFVTWTFQGLTPKMVNWLIVNRLNGGYAALATIRTFNRSTGNWEVFQGRARRMLITEAQRELGGYTLAVQFVDLTQL